MLGLPDALSLSVVAEGAPGTQQCLSLSGTGWEVGAYEVVLEGDLVVSVFGSPYALGNYPLSFVVDIVANPNGIAGCTYVNATNFQPFATLDDGSCDTTAVPTVTLAFSCLPCGRWKLCLNLRNLVQEIWTGMEP